MKPNQSLGFTLIEILVVVVVVSIISVLGVQLLNAGSVERNLKQHGQIFESTVNYICEQATLQNVPYGVSFSQQTYQFSHFRNNEWLEINNREKLNRTLTDGSQFELTIDGTSVVLKEDEQNVPQIYCDSSGQLTPFILLISDAQNKHHYQVKTVGFWEVQGQWLDEI